MRLGIGKIIVLGPANAGKTSIARFLITIDRQYALQTTPSTSVEKYWLSIFNFKVNVFVTPGQKRFKKRNFEYLDKIIDSSTTVLYVVDSSEKSRLKDNLEEFIELLYRINTIFSERYPGDKAEVVLLAHKRDIPGSVPAKKLLNDKLKSKLAEIFPRIDLYAYDTSIYMPASIFKMFQQVVLSKLIPLDSMSTLVRRLRAYTGAETVVIGDYMGFPVVFDGNLDLASWSSSFSARVIESLEREREVSMKLGDNSGVDIFRSDCDFKISLKLALGKKRIIIFIRSQTNQAISLAVINPREGSDIVEDYLSEIADKLLSKIYRRV